MKPITTGILQNEIRHLTSEGDAALERHKEWGYYALAGAVSTATNPHNGDFRPFCVFYTPFRLEQSFERGEGKGKDERWIARAFVVLLNRLDTGVGEFFLESYTAPSALPTLYTDEGFYIPNGRVTETTGGTLKVKQVQYAWADKSYKSIDTQSLGFPPNVRIHQRIA